MTINDADNDNHDAAAADGNDDDSYSGDLHAYNAPKVSVLLDSIILSTGPTGTLRHMGSTCSSTSGMITVKSLQRTYVQTTAYREICPSYYNTPILLLSIHLGANESVPVRDRLKTLHGR